MATKIFERMENMDGQWNVRQKNEMEIPYEGGEFGADVFRNIVDAFERKHRANLGKAVGAVNVSRLFQRVECSDDKAVFLIGIPGKSGQLVRWTYEAR